MELNRITPFRALVILSVGAVSLYAVTHRSPGMALLLVAATVVLWRLHARWQRTQSRRIVLEHPLPGFLRTKLREHYPQLSDAQAHDVERGLRQFFVASAAAGGKFVAMPSKVVDALWHEFILHTRGYETFCRRAFGRLLHHTPAEAMPPQGLRRDRQAGLRRAWYWSCREEGIDPRKPDRLPLLFALDTTLAISGGYHYMPDCSLLGADRGGTHCATGFGCGSSCGSSGGSDGGGGDGGGDAGGNCGSGCGGGD